jgi:sialate O-acetylesterase
MKILRTLIILLASALGSAVADVKLPAIISDHMVLQRTDKVPIWGWAESGENVAVTLDDQTAKTTADANGKWRVSLNLKDSAVGPFEMVVEGKNKLTVTDVVVGEVWVASGQSNMEFRVKATAGANEVIAKSENPQIRHFLVKLKSSLEPLDDTVGKWVVASPATTGEFSAVGYFFARSLQATLKVPVGLIHSSWGGTPSEAWTSVPAIDSVPDLKEARERLWTMGKEYPAKRKLFNEQVVPWLKEHGREDQPTPDAAPFTGETVTSEGWVPVTLPGEVKAEGLPEAGVVWLRKEIDIPKKSGVGMGFMLPIDGFDSVYWNGKLLKTTTPGNYPGNGSTRRDGPFFIPDSAVKTGKNVIAIRLYEPLALAKFTSEPRLGPISLAGEWMAKAETAFPPTTPEVLATAPATPAFFRAFQFTPSTLFNGMINPILPYAIKGAIWYQGETNVIRAWQYRMALPLLISDWRRQWKQGDFPFYIVQLANYQPKKTSPSESQWAELREAQTLATKLPNTGIAVAIDLGEANDIHARNKKDVGERLALLALAHDYKQPVPASGPTYESAQILPGKIVLSFKDTTGPLVAKPLPATYDVRTLTKETAPLVRNSPDSQLEGFAICGADKKWVWADAKIEGDTVIVSSKEVSQPIAVRYAWSDNPTCNLYNKAGLPAAPFRTDDFPLTTADTKL